MQTDIVLQKENNILIIDIKFYTENMSQIFYGSSNKHKSTNSYQIFAYVNNWRIKNDQKVSVMLLYAKTNAIIQPDHYYSINCNSISILTVDLNQNFSEIYKFLLEIAEMHF